MRNPAASPDPANPDRSIISTLTLGRKARDVVSGFAGTLTSVYAYLNGCYRYEITRDSLGEDGKPVAVVFDEQQIEYLDVEATSEASESSPAPSPTGGSRDSSPVPR